MDATKDMKSRRIKIIVTLLVLAAIVAAIFLRPKRFHVDRTQYELISLHKAEYKSTYVIGINRLGDVLGGIESTDGKREIVKWHLDGSFETIPLPADTNAYPYGMNDKGNVVGHYSYRKGQVLYDAFCWDSISGFRSLSVHDAFQYNYNQAEFINDQGQIAGIMTFGSRYNRGCFYYDPTEGLCDIGTLGGSFVILQWLDEKGTIVGSVWTIGKFKHAFLWTKKEGMKDFHSAVAPQAQHSEAFAISQDGWILVQATDPKRDIQIIWYHPDKGIGPSCSFGEYLESAMPVGESDRFVFQSVRPSWYLKRIRIRPTVHHNWLLDLGHNPVLIAPKVLSDETWSIYGMTEQGLIIGALIKGVGTGTTTMGVEPFFLRPIRPGDSGKK